MKLTQLHYCNYRLLKDALLNVDESMTMIVGRNNTGKTSCMDFLYKVLNGKDIFYDDYPLDLRKNLCEQIFKFFSKEITYEELLNQIKYPSISFIVDYSLEKNDELLGSLSPFIIDVLDEVTTANIHAKYLITINEDKFKELFNECIICNEQGQIEEINKDNIRIILIDNFSQLFKLTIYAENPIDFKSIIPKM